MITIVNLWVNIPPSRLCDRHLNAACNEGLNLLIRHNLKRGYSILGYIRNGCVDIGNMQADPDCIAPRIRALIHESQTRGKKWNYQLTAMDNQIIYNYFEKRIYPEDVIADMQKAISLNPSKLAARCPECRKRLVEKGVIEV